MKKSLLALMLASAFGTASAATVNFQYLDNAANTVASGAFSYSDGLSGVLNYGNLSSFNVNIGSVNYTLADVVGFTDYVWFGYDTAANNFAVNTNLCGFAGCGFTASLAAINSTGSSGFFFTGAPGVYAEYSTPIQTAFNSIQFSRSNNVPEPASLALLGLGLVGLVASRRRKTA